VVVVAEAGLVASSAGTGSYLERRWMPSSSGVAVAEATVATTEVAMVVATAVAAAVAVREVAEATTEATTAEAMMVATAVAVMAVAA